MTQPQAGRSSAVAPQGNWPASLSAIAQEIAASPPHEVGTGRGSAETQRVVYEDIRSDAPQDSTPTPFETTRAAWGITDASDGWQPAGATEEDQLRDTDPPAVEIPPLPELPSDSDPMAPALIPEDPETLPAPALEPQPSLEAPLAPSPMTAADPAHMTPMTMPAGFCPWWNDLVLTALRDSECTLPVGVDLMVCQALSHSPHIMAMHADPEIRRTQIVQEHARFDWTAFIESRYDDISDPVGNTLTTGGPKRFEDRKISTDSGLRRQNTLGGKFEASQRLGWEDQNSRFFVPSPQRTAKLQLAYTQPLLQGAGRAYNESRIVLAKIGTQGSLDQVAEDLQKHLLRVSTTFWELYRARAVYLQRLQFLDNAEQILETLEARQEVDALRQQTLRARAAVASRRTSLVRAGAEIKDAESRLKLLVNHPSLLDNAGLEIVPSEHPTLELIPVSRTDSLNVALMHRPDISRATQETRAAGVRLGVAENELLPRLDLILSSYVYGLEGDNLRKAYGSQFAEGRPSFAAGLQFEMPLGNRAAEAKEQQRQWELTRVMHEYRAIVESGMTEVDLAVREVETSYLEMLSRWEAMAAAQQETEYLKERWLWIGGADRAAAGLLEELFLSQERLVDEEEAFVTAQVRYVIALSEVRRATGTLLQCVPGNREIPATPTMSLPAAAEVPFAVPSAVAPTPAATAPALELPPEPAPVVN